MESAIHTGIVSVQRTILRHYKVLSPLPLLLITGPRR